MAVRWGGREHRRRADMEAADQAVELRGVPCLPNGIGAIRSRHSSSKVHVDTVADRKLVPNCVGNPVQYALRKSGATLIVWPNVVVDHRRVPGAGFQLVE